MGWDILLGAALEASLGVLAAAGFEDEIRALKERLTQRGEKARRGAFERAYRRAVEAAGEESLRPLLEHRPFQEKVITGLLDPETGFDLPALAAEQEDGLSPAQARALRRFFAALENALLADETWGPLLERFQDLRFRRDVSGALRERRLDVPTTRLVSTLNAQLHGSGAIAQDQGVAATTGGVAVGGDVGRVVQIVIQQLTLGATPLSTGARPETLRLRYLKELARETDRLPWGSLEREYADPEGGESLGLAQVYTALDTTDLERVEHEEDLRRLLARMERDEARRVSAQAQVNDEPRLLILGDPGSGKSTFANYLTHVLAQAGLAPDAAPWLAQIAPWDHGPLLPVRVELRALAAQVEGRERGDARLLLDHLRRELETWQLGDFWPHLRGAIRDEEETLLFALDGLDEAPAGLRGVVIETVQAFADSYPRHRYVVTCRPYAYVGQPRQLRGFRQVTLAPFNAEQVEHFVRTWYRELARRGRLAAQEAEERAGRLVQAVGRGDLWALAQRPLLLTVMTLLHTFRGQLPDDRTELYADAVDLLLRRWEGRLGREVGLVERLGMPDLKMSDLQAGLYAVAFRAHSGMEAAGGGTADVDEAELRRWLAPYLGGDWNKAGEFVDYIRERAGLLVRHKTQAYTFPHRTFQEFLAACYLVVESADYAGQAASLVRADLDRWREVFVLAAGHAARTHRLGQAIAAVNALCPRDVARVAQPDAPAFRQAALAGEALLEIGLLGVRREEAGRAALERVQDWLVAAIQADRALEGRERGGAGRVLAHLGDPRPEVLRPEAMVFCHVPAGPFWMGSSEEDEMAQDREKPLHRVEIPYDYWLARYPVTVAQFRAFVEAEGFRPSDPDSLRDPDNHPVKWINWHEARAFCAWLTERLCESASQRIGEAAGEAERAMWEGFAAGRLVARLPSEAEWEKGARGALPPGGGDQGGARRYPWGDDPDPGRANYNETGVGSTSAVGCFPGGVSPYGCLDMAGNVWEWTQSEYKAYPYDPRDGREDLEARADVRRVLRGGSFISLEWSSRCAYRVRNLPDYRDMFDGFRVVAAPFSHASLPSGPSALGHSGKSALRRERSERLG